MVMYCSMAGYLAWRVPFNRRVAMSAAVNADRVSTLVAVSVNVAIFAGWKKHHDLIGQNAFIGTCWSYPTPLFSSVDPPSYSCPFPGFRDPFSVTDKSPLISFVFLTRDIRS